MSWKRILARQITKKALALTVSLVTGQDCDFGDGDLDFGGGAIDTGDAGFDAGDGGFDAGDGGFDAGDGGFDAGDGGIDTGYISQGSVQANSIDNGGYISDPGDAAGGVSNDVLSLGGCDNGSDKGIDSPDAVFNDGGNVQCDQGLCSTYDSGNSQAMPADYLNTGTTSWDFDPSQQQSSYDSSPAVTSLPDSSGDVYTSVGPGYSSLGTYSLEDVPAYSVPGIDPLSLYPNDTTYPYPECDEFFYVNYTTTTHTQPSQSTATHSTSTSNTDLEDAMNGLNLVTQAINPHSNHNNAHTANHHQKPHVSGSPGKPYHSRDNSQTTGSITVPPASSISNIDPYGTQNQTAAYQPVADYTGVSADAYGTQNQPMAYNSLDQSTASANSYGPLSGPYESVLIPSHASHQLQSWSNSTLQYIPIHNRPHVNRKPLSAQSQSVHSPASNITGPSPDPGLVLAPVNGHTVLPIPPQSWNNLTPSWQDPLPSWQDPSPVWHNFSPSLNDHSQCYHPRSSSQPYQPYVQVGPPHRLSERIPEHSQNLDPSPLSWRSPSPHGDPLPHPAQNSIPY